METHAFSFFIFPIAASVRRYMAEGRPAHHPLLTLAQRQQQDVEVSYLGF